MKIKSFISSIFCLIVSFVSGLIIYNINQSMASITGAENLALFVLVPLYVIGLIVNCVSSLSGFGSSISACFSENKVIKIISILILILNIVLVGFSIWLVFQAISLI